MYVGLWPISQTLVSPIHTKPVLPLWPVGDLIYVFGGTYKDNKKYEMSYIDTKCPNKGWNLCQSQMPKGLKEPYPITLKKNDTDSVLLVSGLLVGPKDHPFAQMYYPLEDKLVVIEKEPDERPYLSLYGHAVVEKGGETIVVMHDYRSRKLFTYNVDNSSWGTLWDGEFGQYYHTGALVGRIYYVLDVFWRDSVSLCGYDLESKKAKCLPVTILAEKKKKKKKNKVEKEWVPFPTGDPMETFPKLFSVGDSKMAMVWHSWCCDMNSVYSSVHWSTFEMINERTDDELKLFARPLCNVCYHINAFGGQFNCFVPVFPSNTVRTKFSAVQQGSPPTRGGKGKETSCQH